MNTKYAQIAQKLKIKYGLRNTPSDSQVENWKSKVELKKKVGLTVETAGRSAAEDIFTDYSTVKYASQADTIEALLEEIARMEREGR
ncbi:hypothetical protein DDZ13_15020 [Coraliomargarita sinensis]|uniref:Uncharacterized protein n=1 Tax=Coraliomargarita sinensis TaxID=2174842 RepID=A0A317ZCY5_9BACT|nr:hypothetical protein [Coraliomargarita sinensis]PXA02850.1 hypothetical protein DDZ13_15020 [Coraliomargarita sinensis]